MADVSSIQEIHADIKDMDKLAEEVWSEIVKREKELDSLDEKLDVLDSSIVGASKLIENILGNKTGGGNVEMDGRKRHLQAIEELELKIGGGSLQDREEVETAMDELEGMHTLLKLHDKRILEKKDSEQQFGGVQHQFGGVQHQFGGAQPSRKGVSGNTIAAQVALAATLIAFSML